MPSVSRIISLTTIALMLVGLSWLFFSGKLSLINTTEVSKGFSQFIGLEPKDEYVIAELETNEEFITEKYHYVMGFPVGDTNAKLSLVANYKYYIKLAELTHNIENDIVFIHIPKLYLSTPVAFEFSTVRESWSEFLFGPDGKELLNKLKRDASGELIIKGRSQVGVVYDKAAKALADNLNSYFNANGYGRYYKSMVVIFSSEKSQSQRQFNYKTSFCGKESCLLELDLGKGQIFTVK